MNTMKYHIHLTLRLDTGYLVYPSTHLCVKDYAWSHIIIIINMCHCETCFISQFCDIVGIKLYCCFSLTLWLCILNPAEVPVFHFERQLTSFKLTLLPNYQFGAKLFCFISLLQSRLTRLILDTQLAYQLCCHVCPDQSKICKLW